MKAIALGNFDGVHIGHKAVLQNAARFDDAVCLLFRQHPLEQISGKAPARLLSKAQTEQKILACGIDRCEYLDFEQVRDLSAEAFFENILLARYGAQCICCGYNYTFGKHKAGDVARLRELCAQHGVQLMVAEPVEYAGEPISSSRIRRCVQSGEIEAANAMLGFPFFYESTVEEGKKLGRELGFPTINQHLPPSLVKPLSGVYASEVFVDGRHLQGLTNIGDNPTIAGDSFRSETYLFSFEGDVYGKTASVQLMRFVREEKQFESVEALRRQVLSDIERAKTCLKK